MIYNDAINRRYFSQILKIGTTESEDVETEQGTQPKQADNIKLLLFLTNAITSQRSVRSLKNKGGFSVRSLMSRARDIYERLTVTEKRLTDPFVSKRRIVLLSACRRDKKENVFKELWEYKQELMIYWMKRPSVVLI